MSTPFTAKVYYEDTDLGGVVYHANYLKFIERARSEAVEAAGIDQRAMAASGLVFVVRAITCQFRAPARLGDVLEVGTVVRSIGGASLILDQSVHHAGRLLFEAEVRLALMDAAGRPARLGQDLRERLATLTPG